MSLQSRFIFPFSFCADVPSTSSFTPTDHSIRTYLDTPTKRCISVPVLDAHPFHRHDYSIFTRPQSSSTLLASAARPLVSSLCISNQCLVPSFIVWRRGRGRLCAGLVGVELVGGDASGTRNSRGGFHEMQSVEKAALRTVGLPPSPLSGSSRMADDQKGKGKAPAQEGNTARSNETRASSGPGDGVSSAALSLASALRSSMASSQLGSLMQSASGGKAEFAQGGSGNADLREWLVSDLRAGANTSSAGSTTSAPAKPSFRSTSQGARADGAETEHMFKEFERGLTLDQSVLRAGLTGEDAALQQAWAQNTNAGASQAGGWRGTGMDPSTAGSIRSYTELDAPMHASVRQAYAESSSSAGQAQSASRLGSFPASAAPLAQSDDIFALLDARSKLPPNRIATVLSLRKTRRVRFLPKCWRASMRRTARRRRPTAGSAGSKRRCIYLWPRRKRRSKGVKSSQFHVPTTRPRKRASMRQRQKLHLQASSTVDPNRPM